MLSREELLSGVLLQQVEVNVPKLGGVVVIRELSADELVTAYSALPKDMPVHVQGASVLVRALYRKDDAGALVRIFQDDDGPAFARNMPRPVYRKIEKAFNELHAGGAEGESDATGG